MGMQQQSRFRKVARRPYFLRVLCLAHVLSQQFWGASGYHPPGWWIPDEMHHIVNRQLRAEVPIEHNESIGRALDIYMQRAFLGEVEGYLELQAFLTMRLLAASQLENAVSGGIAEIGVHHGLSFTALCLMNADAGSGQGIALGIDVFEDQHLNLDGSGSGNRAIFEKHVQTFCTPHNYLSDVVKILPVDSSTLNVERILVETGDKVRFFSIDASHLALPTYLDMRLAHGALAEGGILVVDDYFAEGFPGVSEGVQRWFREQETCAPSSSSSSSSSDLRRLHPFLIGFNKVYFAHTEFVEVYQEAVYRGLGSIGDSSMHVSTKWMLDCPVLLLTETVHVYKPRRDPLP